MITVATNFSVVYESEDYINPIGNINDNNTNIGLISEIENYFKDERSIKVLDLGCAGGQFAIDSHYRQKVSLGVGIDGVDHALKRGFGNWRTHYNKNLFLANVGEEFQVLDDVERVKFDFISSWELIEHIFPEKLDNYFENINRHLADNGLFIGSISTHQCPHHPSAFLEPFWIKKFAKHKLTYEPYDFSEKLRICGGSYYFFSKKIK